MSNRLPDELIGAMYADYQKPMSLNAVGRKYGRDRRAVSELFHRRGLDVRVTQKQAARLPNGRIAPYVPLTVEQLEELIADATKLRVPEALKFEWRKWSLERRGDFIARIRAKLNDPRDRPDLPFSANVVPFDYASPRAHEICKVVNAGLGSRYAGIKLDICSQGVIYRDRLWFWARKVGYQLGPWIPGEGRTALHHQIWEETHGRPVPEKHVVRFADGNCNNFELGNLVLDTRYNLCRENQAAALFQKSRAMTSMLLESAQNKDTHEQTPTLSLLQRRRR
jgi:hypothetical protein